MTIGAGGNHVGAASTEDKSDSKVLVNINKVSDWHCAQISRSPTWREGQSADFNFFLIIIKSGSTQGRSQKESSAAFRRKKTEDGFLMTHRVTSPKQVTSVPATENEQRGR
ncbi:hypothetical protein HNY73_000135 [Argiope bruennichi]|uniref:Uncharacterized protein n=1 Tax=Argiope bruennichi TaxID=94029 RepID=A0A8T0G326_ARGBR|nr:hypothetical protein HNY73_000135 [Argiope bruennichi]